MEQLLQFFILLPLLGFIVSLFFANKNENAIAAISIATVGIQLVSVVFLALHGLEVVRLFWTVNILLFTKKAMLKFLSICFLTKLRLFLPL